MLAWSAPSAIGTAGVGLGGQAGAEMTDFLVVLNSRSVRCVSLCWIHFFLDLVGILQAIVSELDCCHCSIFRNHTR